MITGPARVWLLLCWATLAALPCACLAAAPDDGEVALARLSKDVRAGKYSNVHAIVMMRDGQLVWEDYFSGADERLGRPLGVVTSGPETLHDVRSISKSMVSAAFGAARARGALPDLDAPVLDFFPEYPQLRTPERLAIRLRHLLTMTSGLAWDETTRNYKSPFNSESAMNHAADPFRYVLTRAVAAPAGTRWNYSGGDTMLLARVIERATGEDLHAFVRRTLLEPLGIARSEWLRYPSGIVIAASGLRLSARDLASFGQLHLDAGLWQGKPLLPADWVRDSLAPHALIAAQPEGFQQYGYQWRLGTARVAGQGLAFAAAVGWGGQRIYLVPSMNAVVVVTAGLYRQRNQEQTVGAMVFERVLPAIARSTCGLKLPTPAMR